MSQGFVPLYERHIAATGADIPQELFQRILWHATNGYVGYTPLDRNSVRALAPMTLVSRYFAGVCRPRLYRRVGLRSGKQLRALVRLLRCSHKEHHKPLLAFTEYLWIAPTTADNLWTHQVLTVLLPQMKLAGIEHTPEILLAALGKAPSLVAGLPRSPTPSLLRPVCMVILHDIFFERGEDLLQCLSALPNGRFIDLRNIDCGTVVDQRAAMRLALRHRAVKVVARQCGSSCFLNVFPAIFSTRFDHANTFLPRDRLEVAVLSELIHAAFDSAPAGSEWMISRQSGYFQVTLRHSTDSYLKITLSPATAPHSPAQTDLIIEHDVRRYVCSIYVPYIPRGHRDLWSQFPDLIATLRHLETLRFEFDNRSLMKAFVVEQQSEVKAMHIAGQHLEFFESATSICEPALNILDRFGILTSPGIPDTVDSVREERAASVARIHGSETEVIYQAFNEGDASARLPYSPASIHLRQTNLDVLRLELEYYLQIIPTLLPVSLDIAKQFLERTRSEIYISKVVSGGLC